MCEGHTICFDAEITAGMHTLYQIVNINSTLICN